MQTQQVTPLPNTPAGVSVFDASLYDATPQITDVAPNSLPAGQATTITIAGNSFGGTPGSVRVCAYPVGEGPCTQLPSWTIEQVLWGAVISAKLTSPPGATGHYCVQVTRLGVNGAPFAPAPNSGSSATSGCGDITETPAEIAMKLELLSTVISTDGNYSEDSTIRVTAIDANTHAPVTTFTGTVNIAEDSAIPIYTQNQSPSGLRPSVTISSGGTATFVARSLAGPKREGNNGAPPDPASIITTNYPMDGGAPLVVPQWIISSTTPRIDPRSSGDVYDWFQARARDVFASATGDLKTVLETISNYTIAASISSGGGCQTNWVRAAQSPVVCVPYFMTMRLDSPTTSTCGIPRTKAFTNSLYHEARHAYQASLAAIPGNDGDGDFLPLNDAPIAPKSILRDNAVQRNVCRTSTDSILSWAYHGDAVFDKDGDPDFASYAREMDAYTFAGAH